MPVFYTVPKIGSGTKDDPYRPDISTGTSFVGYEKDGVYLILTPMDLPAQAGRKKELPRQMLEAAANAKGLSYDDVSKWFIGG